MFEEKKSGSGPEVVKVVAGGVKRTRKGPQNGPRELAGGQRKMVYFVVVRPALRQRQRRVRCSDVGEPSRVGKRPATKPAESAEKANSADVSRSM